MEKWKQIEESNYEISDRGRVRNSKTNKILKSQKSNGYKLVNLATKEGVKRCRVHRLVAKAFIPNPDNLPEVNHKNMCKSDNNVENLEWVSREDNFKHAYENNLKLSRKKPIVGIDLILNEVRYFESMGEATRFISRMFKKPKKSVYGNISLACNKKLRNAYQHKWYSLEEYQKGR